MPKIIYIPCSLMAAYNVCKAFYCRYVVGDNIEALYYMCLSMIMLILLLRWEEK